METANPKLTLRSMQIVHLALMIGVALFMVISFVNNANSLALLPVDETHLTLVYVACGMAVVSAIIGSALFNNLLGKIDTSSPLSQKLPQYFSANITRWALLEGAALFNVVAFLLSGSLLNVGVAILLLVLMGSLRPSRQRVTDELKISYPDVLE